MTMTRNERTNALNNANMDGFYSVTANNIPVGAKVTILVDGKPMDLNDFIVKDPHAKEIMNNGYVNNTKLFRRWITAQTFHMLNYKGWNGEGWNAALKSMDYKYSWDTTLNEMKALAAIERDGDEDYLKERIHFFDKHVVICMLNDYVKKLNKYCQTWNAEHKKTYMGVPYVKLNRYGNVFMWKPNRDNMAHIIDRRLMNVRYKSWNLVDDYSICPVVGSRQYTEKKVKDLMGLVALANVDQLNTIFKDVKKLEESVHIYNADNFTCIADITDAIKNVRNKICAAKNYTEVYKGLKDFMDNWYNKLPYDTAKSAEWKDAYKGAGAYYTLKNLVMFHNVKLVDNLKGKFRPLKNSTEGVAYLKSLLDVYYGEGWRFHEYLKMVIEYNDFDLAKSIEAHKN